ncbi:hypothetical protein EGW08_019013 [Elysia chlorotica]|uniref:Uncharacterized protein n=1 Tax=Elysia chlorotica TaxID=188477 RepID=A0A3S0ZAF5_ELYCH|nr:hypothetical protein EGW08_019013 [Elysia chlorotica]
MSDLPRRRPTRDSNESLFASSRKDHGCGHRTPVCRRKRSIFSRDQIFDVHVPSPRVPGHRGPEQGYRLGASHFDRFCPATCSRRQTVAALPAYPPARLSVAAQAGYVAERFDVGSMEQLSDCDTVSAALEFPEGRFSVCHNRKGGRFNLKLKEDSGSTIKRSGCCEEQLFRKTAEDVPKELEEWPEYSDSTVDNIVLTIAHDHIVNLRKQYNNLRGNNIWQRYRRMKSIIKSCMNVLKR